jgi:ribosome-associated toxin RatA of RatAB toxin-antitoxin module
MSEYREQALIEAPASDIWELVGNPARYPEWWPRVLEVDGRRFEEGTEYVQVTDDPGGKMTTTFQIDRLEDLREIRMHCTLTGTYAHWRLTDAQGETFVDLALGMDPIRKRDRVFDVVAGKRFFRKWASESLTALKEKTRAVVQS